MTTPKPSSGWLNIAAQFSEETILYLGQKISRQDLLGFDLLLSLPAPRSPPNTQSAKFWPRWQRVRRPKFLYHDRFPAQD